MAASASSSSTGFRHRRLGYVALNVTDLARSTAFYRDLVGLDVSATTATTTALRCSRDHHNLLLHAADQPGVKRIAFELESVRDLERAAASLEGAGVATVMVEVGECRALGIGRALRFRMPECDLCIEYFVDMAPCATPFAARLTQIERIGHVVVNVQRFDPVLAFLTGTLGFRVSDYVPGFAAFLRCHPNPLHHSMALLHGKDRLNHVNFMVTDIDDIGRAMNRMKANGVEIVFGPGRHQPSESIFLYFLDPDGMTVEYSFGMERFPEDDPRAARHLDPVPATLDTWGSIPAPRFGKVGAIETQGAAP